MTQETKSVLIQFKGEATNLLQTEKKVTEETKKLSREFQKVGKANKNFGNQFQNIGYQLQDFAVQVGGGTDAMRAFSQQAPQLLSPLGNIGIAAATAVAVLVPLAKAIFDSAESAEQAGKSFEAFDRALQGLTASGGGFSKYKDAIASASAETRKLFRELYEAQGLLISVQLDDATKELEKFIKALYTPPQGTRAGPSQELREIKELMNNFGVDQDVARDLKQIFDQYASGSISVTELNAALLEQANSGAISSSTLTELTALVGELARLTAEKDAFSKPFESLGKAGKSAYEAMVPLADYLRELEVYADAVARRQDPTINMVEQINLAKDAYDRGLLSLQQYNKELENIAGLKKRSTALEESLALFDKEILGLGKDDGIKSLLEELQTEAGKWADQFADTLVSGLADGKLAFKDFADYVLQQLARIALSKALEPLFNSFGDWIGGITGAAAPVPTGLIAVPANDLPISREMSSAQPMIVGVPRMSAPSSSSSPVTVNVYNQGSNEVEVNERKTTRGVEVDVLIKNAVKQGFASGDFDKVMATSYGARRLAY